MIDTIPSDQIINNLKKISDKYQEVILYLMQGKGNMIPPSLVDMDKNRMIATNLQEQFLENPEKFWQLNLEYVQKFQTLITNSVDKFTGHNPSPLFVPADRDRRFRDASWENNAYFDFIKQFYLMSSEWLQRNIELYDLSPELKNTLNDLVLVFRTIS
ncbi:MAG: hypothetical protein LN588_04120 [Rickettsia endosymbiont of Bryobia graminum]|nr:hypothetical protein [Rickettsia endosymbiont of Bryobia graminum]